MRRFLILEGVLSVLVTVLFSIWLYKLDGLKYFIPDSSNYFPIVFAGLVALFGSLLGFIIASITFLFGAVAGETFVVLRASKSYPEHWAIFKAALKACFFATFISLLGLFLLPTQGIPAILLVAVFGVTVWAAFRIARVVWVICKMIDAEVQAGKVSRDKKFSS